MAVFALVQAVEVCLGRLLLCTDRQAATAGFVAAGAVLSVILNLLWVPHYGINGAIYAGAAAYAAIDVLCIAALRRPLGGAALGRMLASLAVSLAVGSGLAALLALRSVSASTQAAASLAGFVVIAALAYRFRHGTIGGGLGPPRTAS
jgi:O-antigen/teichoic acid export membrane protein